MKPSQPPNRWRASATTPGSARRPATSATELSRVVDLNERAKALRRYAFEVSLRALGAIVRSRRAGNELRGFNEVATQMRHWSRDLDASVRAIQALAAQRVHLVSDMVKATRLSVLLSAAGADGAAKQVLGDHAERAREGIARHRAQLHGLDERLVETIDGIAQLGLMASVLSRAALIEAASGRAQQRQDLTIASREFAVYAEQVNEAISAVRALNGGSRA